MRPCRLPIGLQRIQTVPEDIIHLGKAILDQAIKPLELNRIAAMAMGVERLRGAKATRGLFP